MILIHTWNLGMRCMESYRIDGNGSLFVCYWVHFCDGNNAASASSLATHLLGTSEARLGADPFIQGQEGHSISHYHRLTIQSE